MSERSPLHLIQTETGAVILTACDLKASDALQNSRGVSSYLSMDELIKQHLRHRYLPDSLDVSGWKRISRILLSMSSEISDLFPTNPANLPVAVAERRLHLVQKFMNSSELRSLVELTELILAGRENRRPDLDLLGTKSAEASFHKILSNPACQIEAFREDTKRACSDISSMAHSEQGQHGRISESTESLMALVMQQQFELEYLFA